MQDQGMYLILQKNTLSYVIFFINCFFLACQSI